MTRSSRLFVPAVLTCVSLLLVAAGCEPAAAPVKPKPDATPKMSLKESLTKVTSLATKITEGFGDGESEKAHDPIHEIGHLLEDLPGMIKGSELTEESKSNLSGAVETLMDAFGKIDEKMHVKDVAQDDIVAEFNSAKAGIESALKTIASIADSMKP